MQEAPTSVQVATRTPTTLVFQWIGAADAVDFETELSDSEGIRAQLTTNLHTSFDSLVPNRTYTFRVRARGVGGVSSFSHDLQTCTELPSPATPDVSPVPTHGVLVLVTWDWSALRVDETDAVTTNLVRESGGVPTVVVTTHHKSGTFTDSGGWAGANYQVELRSSKASAPGGMNVSRSGGRNSVAALMLDASAPHETAVKFARFAGWV
jgi:hypothetical protein